MWIVYILLNRNKNQTYIGSTNNFKKRLKEHNHNLVISTRYKGPWIPLYVEFYPTEKDVRIREGQLKTSVGRRYLKKVINNIIQKWSGSSVGPPRRAEARLQRGGLEC